MMTDASRIAKETGTIKTDTVEKEITKDHVRVAIETEEKTDIAKKTNIGVDQGVGATKEVENIEKGLGVHLERTFVEDHDHQKADRMIGKKKIEASDLIHHLKITKFLR